VIASCTRLSPVPAASPWLAISGGSLLGLSLSRGLFLFSFLCGFGTTGLFGPFLVVLGLLRRRAVFGAIGLRDRRFFSFALRTRLRRLGGLLGSLWCFCGGLLRPFLGLIGFGFFSWLSSAVLLFSNVLFLFSCVLRLGLLLGIRNVFHLIVFLFGFGRFLFLLAVTLFLLSVLLLSLLLLFFLGLAVGLFTTGTVGLLLNLELGCTLNDVVARSCDVNGGVLRIGILLDGVAAIGLDGDLALLLNLGNLAARVPGAPFPRDC
jgi:hypothetical protein